MRAKQRLLHWTDDGRDRYPLTRGSTRSALSRQCTTSKTLARCLRNFQSYQSDLDQSLKCTRPRFGVVRDMVGSLSRSPNLPLHSLPGPLAPSLPGPLAPSLPCPLASLLLVCLAPSLHPFAEVSSLVSWIAGSAPWRGEAAVDRLCATQGPRGHARLHTRCAMDGAKGEPRAV